MAKRVDGLEKFVEEKLLDVIQEAGESMRRNSDCLNDNTKAMADLIVTFECRPCLLDNEQRLEKHIERVVHRLARLELDRVERAKQAADAIMDNDIK